MPACCVLAQGLLASIQGKSNCREVNIRFAAGIGDDPGKIHDGMLNVC
ncbi:MAG: hypothetical protein Q9M25_06880 [Mariprofundaceae bacterium]|nr:hypothetical protein [Mariprofundaceae bacterium]